MSSNILVMIYYSSFHPSSRRQLRHTICINCETKLNLFLLCLCLQIVEHEPSENWTLQIKFAQLRDSGIYEVILFRVLHVAPAELMLTLFLSRHLFPLCGLAVSSKYPEMSPEKVVNKNSHKSMTHPFVFFFPCQRRSRQSQKCL